MKYRRINEATVQCVITYDDMEEYGLTLTDIFERNEKGEEFLRDVIERAHEEVGYKINSGNVAMQITPLKDKGLVVTFTEESPAAFKEIMNHLKEVLSEVGAEVMGNESAKQQENAGRKSAIDSSAEQLHDTANDDRRMFVFASLHACMRYVAGIPTGFAIPSKLIKLDEAYYLIMDKGRMSYKNFNKISAQGVEFGTLIAVTDENQSYLEEHGECLIEEKAVTKLRKIYKA